MHTTYSKSCLHQKYCNQDHLYHLCVSRRWLTVVSKESWVKNALAHAAVAHAQQGEASEEGANGAALALLLPVLPAILRGESMELHALPTCKAGVDRPYCRAMTMSS